ncbi:hypothetical protein T01_10137 [Trichinella spiralis]|uniref:Uncharacterized protein n=1 Tax=Trichinella spiralis TaxID=6334 RepID=A0A0V1AJM2_TRISP|nr:hypothetical protein T01_10137 [Trichinella spiralis]
MNVYNFDYARVSLEFINDKFFQCTETCACLLDLRGKQ